MELSENADCKRFDHDSLLLSQQSAFVSDKRPGKLSALSGTTTSTSDPRLKRGRQLMLPRPPGHQKPKKNHHIGPWKSTHTDTPFSTATPAPQNQLRGWGQAGLNTPGLWGHIKQQCVSSQANGFMKSYKTVPNDLLPTNQNLQWWLCVSLCIWCSKRLVGSFKQGHASTCMHMRTCMQRHKSESV